MASEPLINGVYYPCWRIYRDLPPSSLQLDCITHVYYAFLLLDESGELVFMDEWADCQIAADGEQGCIAAVAKLKEAKPGLRTLVSLGGGTGSGPFAAMAADPAARAAFAQNCRRFVDERGLDGVDVDWEHPETPEAGADYVALLQALRDALPAPRYVLSTALPPGEWVLRNIDLDAAGQLLDCLNLMGYDFNGAWTDVCGHHAQLLPPPGDPEDVYPALRSSCHAGVEYLLGRGFPAHKIVLGIPVYGRSFQGAHGHGQPFAEAGEMDYNEMPLEWIHGAEVDENVAAASYVDASDEGKGFVSFDVPETVRRKAEYVRMMGLGGLFYWTGVGDVNGPESLVRAGYEGLQAGSG